MESIVWLLSQILETALRVEHKLDILVAERRSKDPGMAVPRMSGKNFDSVTGKPVIYSKAYLEEYLRSVVSRAPSDTPTTTEPSTTVR